MQRLLEILLGLEKGFLSREGELSLQFNPQWPGQQWVGAVSWNVLLAVAMLALVIYVYRHEGRSRGVKIALGVTRGLILAFLLVLLNRPLLTLGQIRTEPSVLAVMVDDSISMRVRDAGDGNTSRLEAVLSALSAGDRALLSELAKKHQIRLYRFDSDKEPISLEALSKL